MIQGLQFIMLHVTDVAEAATFYSEKLGLKIEDQNPGFVQFGSGPGGGAVLAIGVGESRPDPGTELWWFVDNADAACADLKAKGVKIVEEPKDEPFGRVFSFKAPGDYILYMLQPGR